MTTLMSGRRRRGNVYRRRVCEHPASFRRLRSGHHLRIGARDWCVVIGHGHSPEHAGLWSPDGDILISGDQVLPRISPNVSVWPTEPDEDPLSLFLDSLRAWRETVPDTVLVLPSHGPPFTGLHARIESLLRHHDSRLDETAALCRDGARAAFDLVACLFRRPLDDHQVFFAIGETLAHLHHLADRERLRVLAPDGLGVVRFRAP